MGIVFVFLRVPFRAASFQISCIGAGEGTIWLLLDFIHGKKVGKTTPPNPKAKEKAIKAIPNIMASF